MQCDTLPATGFTVAEVARRYRVSPDKIHTWIRRGELQAINTASALCGKPRYLILPEVLAAFERRRSAAPQPKPVRRRKRTRAIDYYPDTPPPVPARGGKAVAP